MVRWPSLVDGRIDLAKTKMWNLVREARRSQRSVKDVYEAVKDDFLNGYRLCRLNILVQPASIGRSSGRRMQIGNPTGIFCRTRAQRRIPAKMYIRRSLEEEHEQIP